MKKLINYLIRYFRSKFKWQRNTDVKLIEYTPYIINDFDRDIIKELNLFRASKGLKELEIGSLDCFDVVGQHAFWMHVNIKDGEDFSKRGHFYAYSRFQQIKLRDKNIKHLGEVLAFNYLNPKSVVYGWFNSESHREIIMSEKFSDVVIASKGKYVIGMLYGK